MKAIIMAFGQNEANVCEDIREILNYRGAALECAGQEKVGNRYCYAAVADFSDGASLKDLQEGLGNEGKSRGLEIKVLRPCLFLAMHRVVPTVLGPAA